MAVKPKAIMIPLGHETYLELYSRLLQKFKTDFYPDEELRRHTKEAQIWDKKLKENMKGDAPQFLDLYKEFYGKKAVEVVFGALGTSYYQTKKIDAEKAVKDFSLKPEQLYKALKYISDIKPWSVEWQRRQDKNRPRNEELTMQAKVLLADFESSLPQQKAHTIVESIGLERKSSQSQVSTSATSSPTDSQILRLITDVETSLELPTIKKIVTEYFDSISARNHHNAWLLLSPDFQEKSMWDGKFKRFEDSYCDVTAIKVDRVFDFSISAQSVQFGISYVETGVIYDILDFFQYLKNLFNTYPSNIDLAFEPRAHFYIMEAYSIEEQMVSFLEKYWKFGQPDIDRSGWNKPSSFEIDKLSLRDFSNLQFHKFFSIYKSNINLKLVPGDTIFPIEGRQYSKRFSAVCRCIFFKGKWLIDQHSIKYSRAN